MSVFMAIDDQLNGLIAALPPAVRRKLVGEIAKQLRKSRQQRIKQQKNGWFTVSDAKTSGARVNTGAD